MQNIPYCRDCTYFKEEKRDKKTTFKYCIAFPKGIPHKFVSGKELHDYVTDDQEGRHFFNPKGNENKYFYKSVDFSFEGYEAPKIRKFLRRQAELDYELKSPPVKVEVTEEEKKIIKQNIIKPEGEVVFYTFPFGDKEKQELEQEILRLDYTPVTIKLWKMSNGKYMLLTGESLSSYKLYQKHKIDFDVEVLEFSDTHAVCEWLLHPYFTDPNIDPSFLGNLRFSTRNKGFFE